MKKILSLILVAIMLVTAMPVVFAEGNTYKVGDIIQFGSYPQSEVKDEALIAELNALAPEWEDWTSYGYYSGYGSSEFGSMEQGDWMRYIDIMNNGNEYRGVKFIQYRPSFICDYSSASNTCQDDNGYKTNTVYWFKFEPIDWRILDPTTGLVMCETIIDSQPYSNKIYYNKTGDYEYFNDSLYKNYANDYETSSIRQWLNNDFYQTAFTNNEKKEIGITTLNNDGYGTLSGYKGYERYDSNKTYDKIFLLSYNEARNSNFGFSSYYNVKDKYRQAHGTEYAQCQGLFVYRSSDYGNSDWLLRSPGSYSNYCCNVYDGGNFNDYFHVDSSYSGVRPALYFNDITNIHNHKYTSEITTPATHTKDGVETFICHCGDTYTKSVPKLTEHTYTSIVTTEPTHLNEGVRTYICECNATYTESIPKLEEHNHIPTVTAPTCTTKGYTTYSCECGDSYTDNIVDERHTFSTEWTIDEDPTCKNEGIKSHHCEFCPARTDITTLEKLAHNFVSVRIEPSCLDDGRIITACKCGEEIIKTIPATGHNIVGSACTECDYDKSFDCSCNCHKSGIPHLIFKIILFFQKLFGQNRVCACGVKH